MVDAFELSDADRTDLVTAPRGYGLFLTRAGRAFVEVLASPEEHRLYTTRPDEVAAIEAEERAARAQEARRRAPERPRPGGPGPRRGGRAVAARAEPDGRATAGPTATGSTGACTPASGWRPSSGPWSPGPPPPPPWPWRCPCAPCGGRSRAGARRGSPPLPAVVRPGGLGGGGRRGRARARRSGPTELLAAGVPGRRGVPGGAGRLVRLRRRGRALAAGHPGRGRLRRLGRVAALPRRLPARRVAGRPAAGGAGGGPVVVVGRPARPRAPGGAPRPQGGPRRGPGDPRRRPPEGRRRGGGARGPRPGAPGADPARAGPPAGRGVRRLDGGRAAPSAWTTPR